MHILIIPSWYPAYPEDINGSFFREQALALKNKKHKVGVIVPYLNSVRRGVKAIKEIGVDITCDKGIETYRFNSINITPRINSIILWHWVELGKKLFRIYIREHGKPDVIHVHSMNKGIFLAYEIERIYKIPYVVTEHSSAFLVDNIDNELINKLSDPLKKSKYRIAVSQSFATVMEKTFDNTRWIYIPNIVSQQFFDASPDIVRKPELPDSPKKDYHHTKDNTFHFLSVCFLTENKKIDNLLTAFSKISYENPNVQLTIGGDGPCRKSLEHLADTLNITNKVNFTGMLDRKQVIQQMNKTNAFVLSSEYETFGVVLVEALALGKPVVATRSGGPESIVTDQVGCLVEKNNIAALYTGMKQVYQKEYNPQAIKKYCEQHFSEQVVTAQLEQVYKTVLSECGKTLPDISTGKGIGREDLP